MWKLLIIAGLIGLSSQIPTCKEIFAASGLTDRVNETVAHAIHSITINDLRKFATHVSTENGIPVVNPRLNDPTTTIRVIPNAPYEHPGDEFHGETMNQIDMVMSNIGEPTDGLGPNWSPLERVVHKFHMRDLWEKLLDGYQETKATLEGIDIEPLCACITDVHNNGIYQAVDWIAQHYKSGTPITLLNRPIPKLTDAKSWSVWKSRLLHYYNEDTMNDARVYLACVLNDVYM